MRGGGAKYAGSFTGMHRMIEVCSGMDKGPEMLADLIPKILGFNTPFFKHQKYFVHINSYKFNSSYNWSISI